MRIERLFNVLVLGGAALSVGCGSGDDDDEGKGREAIGEGAGGAASAAGGAESAGGAGVNAGGTEASGGLTGAGGSLDLGCSDAPNAVDPCGCPCCWAEGGNDEPTCGGFCASGNDGKGCCPP
jgi:hypothetical protein